MLEALLEQLEVDIEPGAARTVASAVMRASSRRGGRRSRRRAAASRSHRSPRGASPRPGPPARGSGARSRAGTYRRLLPAGSAPRPGRPHRTRGRRTAQGTAGPRDLEAAEAAARSEHPRQLAQAAFEVLDVADAEADRRRVEAPVGERQREQVAVHPLDPGRLAPRPVQHPLGEVEPGDRRARALRLDGEVARAAARVEHAIARPHDRTDGRAPPAPVEARRHQPVHRVVDRRDPVEHRFDGGWGERAGAPLTPPADERLVDSQLIETSRNHEVDQIVDGLGEW